MNNLNGRFFSFIERPSSVNFMLFNTVWTILVLVYLGVVPIVMSSLYIGIVTLPLLAVTTIFWFSGSIAIAAYLGAGTCDNSSTFCSVYKAAQAATAFGFFIWVMFTVLLVFEILAFLRSGRGRATADAKGTQMTTQTV